MLTDVLPSDHGACLCVLASGSTGNCSVLAIKRNGVTRVCLIDLGLSPRRTFRMLAEIGIRPDQIDDCLVTHLDHDHFKLGWLGRTGIPAHTTLRLHIQHEQRLRQSFAALASRIRVAGFDEPFSIDEHCRVSPLMMSHDDEGVSTFRFDIAGAGVCGSDVSLGFATDLGCITSDLIDHFGPRDGHDAGVDVLAIESNYCPKMQVASGRPAVLQERIMGGRGHLSNHQAVTAISGILPREHVVLLHLSRECNHPNVVAPLHEGADYALTISTHDRPTRWVRIGGTALQRRAPSSKSAGTALESRATSFSTSLFQVV